MSLKDKIDHILAFRAPEETAEFIIIAVAEWLEERAENIDHWADAKCLYSAAEDLLEESNCDT